MKNKLKIPKYAVHPLYNMVICNLFEFVEILKDLEYHLSRASQIFIELSRLSKST